MADIHIQRKKSAPSPWLLILLVLVALAVAAYFVWRNDTGAPIETAAPATAAAPTPLADSLADALPSAADDAAVADLATDAAPTSPAALATYATSQTDRPDYARHGLQLLAATLVDLADRDDLRDPAVSEKRDQLTSVLSRPDEATATLRPAFGAAAALMQAMQQQAYPALERPVNALLIQANQLNGPAESPDERDEVQSFFVRAADILRTLSTPTR